MDRVRFGRALGIGARQAVKTLVTAVDAATAENPSGRSTGPGGPAGKARAGMDAARPGVRPASASGRTIADAAPRQVAETAARSAAKTAARSVVQTRETQTGVRRGTRRLGEAVWRPFVRLSGVLWLEVSGVLFGIFALTALGYLWKLRGAWHAGAAGARSLLGAAIMLGLFGYFCVSSFVRARRRERQR